jgi:aryl-alcohol dehydrogenase-like predicted oxidoreductase
MNQRTFGRTGLQVSEIGYGAWGIGQSMWLGADDDESLRALDRAVDLGVTMIDTALA